MKAKRFKPLVDKLFYIILIILIIILSAATALVCLEPIAFFIMIPVDLLCLYFLISPLFGYVELRESTVFIKYGFILKREIPYARIRALVRARGVYSESMLSLKSALDHVNIKYNVYDVTCVSVKGNDELIEEINGRLGV